MRGGSPIPEPDLSFTERGSRESLMRGGVFRLVERFAFFKVEVHSISN